MSEPVMDDPQEAAGFHRFKFQVGDLVAFRAEQEVADTYMFTRRTAISTPKPMVVIERYLQECHGGRQRQYGIRLFRDDGGDSRVQMFMEPELIAWVRPEPPVRKEAEPTT